jgi:cytoskeletal protein CcmA (bactofilin family)
MWRKTTGAKPSPQASNAQDSAKTPAPPETQKSVTEDTDLAAAAIALEKQQALAPNGNASNTAEHEPELNSVAASELLAAVVAATASPARNQTPTQQSSVQAISSEGPSRIYSGIKIRGEISGTTDLFIDGEVQGKLCFGHASVTVGPSGRVHADIDAREIIVLGTVQGTLRAEENVRLGSQSRVKGNLLTPRIAIEDGARLSGKVDMARGSGAITAASEPEKPAKANALGASV